MFPAIGGKPILCLAAGASSGLRHSCSFEVFEVETVSSGILWPRKEGGMDSFMFRFASAMLQALQLPAADVFASQFQDGCRHLLQAHNGAQLVFDGQAGQFAATALLARQDLI